MTDRDHLQPTLKSFKILVILSSENVAPRSSLITITGVNLLHPPRRSVGAPSARPHHHLRPSSCRGKTTCVLFRGKRLGRTGIILINVSNEAQKIKCRLISSYLTRSSIKSFTINLPILFFRLRLVPQCMALGHCICQFFPSQRLR